MKYNRLGSTDMMVSQLGFGGSAIGGHHGPLDVNVVTDLIAKALACGINYFDTAPWYGFGRAEEILGKAIKGVPRTSYYMATKVGRYDPDPTRMFDFSAERTLMSVEESLKKLGCKYFDIIQVHDIEFAPSLDVIINETLPALQMIKEDGKARYIGITGYSLHVLQDAITRSTKVKIDTVLSYCRCCLHDTELLNYVTKFKVQGLGVIDAAGLGMGLYVPISVLPHWHPATQDIKDACQKAAVYCEEEGVNFTKLALHFNLTREGPDIHLISCANLKALEDNLDVCIHGLNAQEERVLVDVQSKFFTSPNSRNWEGLELRKYWAKLSSCSSPTLEISIKY